MRIERLTDSIVINSVLSDPSIWPFITDDGTPDNGKFIPEEITSNSSVYFLGAYEDDAVMGIFFYHPHNFITYEIHSSMLPEYRRHSLKSAKASLAWMFENTPCLKVITHVPANNLPAKALAERVGMVHEGVNRMSFMKNGEIIDQYCLGITKGELSCQ